MTVRTLIGDCRDILPTLEAESFDCVVSSPPYWGLRDYGVEGQIGLEPTLDGYIEHLAGVASEIHRVLKSVGTFWLNIGDSYVGGGNGGGGSFAKDGVRCAPEADKNERPFWKKGGMRTPPGLKPKDLCLVPERIALRLQNDGWWVRSRIIWAKPNPMPESVADRPTSAHEHVWLLTKSERYFFDAAAIREPDNGRPSGNGFIRSERVSFGGRGKDEPWIPGNGRNARNVWTIASQPYSAAHFATMPALLAERCILAGCPHGGHVLDPFGGAGTTGLVADRLGRHATLIELNPTYVEMQRDRIRGDAPLLVELNTMAGRK